MVYGDRGYRGCEGVIVCDSREMRAKRLVVEGVIRQIKLFNAGSGWRTLSQRSLVKLCRREIVRRDNGKVVEFEEVRYGMLMMVNKF